MKLHYFFQACFIPTAVQPRLVGARPPCLSSTNENVGSSIDAGEQNDIYFEDSKIIWYT